MPGKCPHCNAPTTLEGIRSANGRCPSCGAMVKVKFTGVPRPVSKPSVKTPSEGLKHSLESIGPYEILAEISRGGMGIVYQARDKNLKKTVAIKVLLRGAESSSDELKRFRREAEAAAKLQHSNIVPIHAVGVCQGLHYFVMDFIEGEALSELAARGGVSPRQALDYVEQLADALAYAHAAGVFHRDIKPANVMIDRFGRPQLMDFGLAKDVSSETQLTQVGTTMGTPTYMPPEQAEGDLAGIDSQSDVYSLGAVLYELLTGQPPFEGPTTMAILMKVLEEEPRRPRNINPRIHPDVEAICLKAMAKDKRDRYRSAAEFRDDIRRFKAGEMIEALRGSGLRRTMRFLRRHVQLMAAGLALVLAVAGVAGWNAWKSGQEHARLEENHLRQVADRLAEADGALAGGGAKDLARAEELFKQVLGLAPGEPGALRGLERIAEIRRQQQVGFLLSKGLSYLESGSYAAASDMFEEVLKILKESEPDFARARAGLRRAQGTGTLTLVSKPPGAAVYVAEGKEFAEPEPGGAAAPGRRLGVTPLSRVDIPMGLHRLTLAKEGCGWQSIPVSVERSQDVRVEEEVELFPAALAGGDARAVSNVVRVPAGTVGLYSGRSIEVRELLVDRYEHPNRLGAMPKYGLAFAEAQDLAAKAGKRLPTRAEWIMAAGGAKGLGFPYGNVFKPDYAVIGRSFEEGPLPCGSHWRDRSPCGVYDMSGNISEWVAREGEKPEAPAGEPEEEEATREACGGNWTSIQPDSASVQWSVSYDLASRQDRVGFRGVLGTAGGKIVPATKPKPQAAAPDSAVVVKGGCPKGMIEIRPQPGTPAWELVKYPFCIDPYEFPNEAGKKPRAKVTWHEASKLARDAGLRLATYEEWRVAAGGEKLWKYPSGDSYEPGKLAVGLGAEEGPLESGSRIAAEGPFKGIFDLHGNLAEWVEPRIIEGRKCWGTMGGCWFSEPEHATSLYWEEHAPDHAADTIGFRRAARLEK